MEEIWKDIKGFEGLYQVSNTGKVFSMCRFIIDKNDNEKQIDHKMLSQYTNKNGYKIVKLYKNCKGKSFKVHRLVLESFIENKLNKPCINHMDGNKLNNQLDNLDWVTHKENTQHAFKSGLQKSSSIGKFGKDNRLSKAVVQIQTESIGRVFWSRLEAERKTGISSRKIALCCNGKRRTAGGYKWKNYERSDYTNARKAGEGTSLFN